MDYNDQFRQNLNETQDTENDLLKTTEEKSEEINAEAFQSAHDQHISNTTQQISNANNYTNQNPKKNKNFFQRNFAAIILSVAVLCIAGFAVMQTVNLLKYRDIAIANKSLYQKENIRANELETALSKTEEGKKSLEAINTNLESQNKALDSKATKAETDLKSTQEQLASKLNELNTANAKVADANKQLSDINKQVADINKQLDSKKAEIAKLNNGIAKFAELETYINQFEEANIEYVKNVEQIIVDLNNNNVSLANQHLSAARSQYTVMDETSTKMTSIFDVIKSGNY